MTAKRYGVLLQHGITRLLNAPGKINISKLIQKLPALSAETPG
jgi:hypothetical protein